MIISIDIGNGKCPAGDHPRIDLPETPGQESNPRETVTGKNGLRAAAGREIDLPGAAGSGIDPRETPGGDLVKLLHGANPNTVLVIISSFPDSKVERQAPALREFRRVQVPNAESKRVTIPLDADDLAYWDTEKHAFVPGKGKVIISTWASSADLRLMTEIAVK